MFLTRAGSSGSVFEKHMNNDGLNLEIYAYLFKSLGFNVGSLSNSNVSYCHEGVS